MKISIVVPIYNVEKYLLECLDSIYNQIYKDFEVLLINDGSTDQSGTIAKNYCEIDERFKYFYKENGGSSSARNLGLDKATGDCVTFVDSDDSIEKDYLKIMVQSMQKNNSDAVVCGYKAVGWHGEKQIKIPVENTARNFNKFDLWKYYWEKPTNTIIMACCKLYKAKIFKSLRFEIGKICEDALLDPQIYDACSIITCLPMPLYNYRLVRDGRISNNFKHLKKFERHLFEFRSALFFIDNKYPSYCSIPFIQNSISLYSHYCLFEQNNEVRILFKEIKKKVKTNKIHLSFTYKVRMAFPHLISLLFLVSPKKK